MYAYVKFVMVSIVTQLELSVTTLVFKIVLKSAFKQKCVTVCIHPYSSEQKRAIAPPFPSCFQEMSGKS
jgi:hypothetical protein